MNPELMELGSYRELAPPDDLRRVVDVMWVYARPSTGHRVLPDGGVSLCFESRRDRTGAVLDGKVTIIGPVRTPRFTQPHPEWHLESVRLKPEWCRAVLRADPAEHIDAVDPLAAPPRLLDRLLRTTTSQEAVAILLDEIRARTAAPSLAHNALEMIRAGATSVYGLARQLHVSERQLRRLVLNETSWTPKRFQRVLRMNRTVAATDRDPSPNWSRIAADFGYYDQPHMIAEFRALTGKSPAELHAERRAE